jgi:hypothetical protein
MTEISVSDHQEFNITKTDDGRIRFRHNDGSDAYLMTNSETNKFVMKILRISIDLPEPDPEAPHDP